ncbi:putative glucokinase [Halenospora varia]|nr:putative glucokinase [Halenospora varia]
MSILEISTSIAAQFGFFDEVQRYLHRLMSDLQQGLEQETGTVYLFPTFVIRTATSTEKSSYGFALTINLGGRYLRVCSIELNGNTTFTAKHLKTKTRTELMVAERSSKFFSFIAAQVKTLLKRCNPNKLEEARKEGKQLILGFTVMTLINDAVGTVMARAYSLPARSTPPRIGAIFGTGTNGVYLEKLTNINKALQGEFWDSFDHEFRCLPNTKSDVELDNLSINPGIKVLEKRISADLQTSLGRQLFSVNDRGETWRNSWSSASNTRWAIDISLFSAVAADNSAGLHELRKAISKRFNVPRSYMSIQEAQAIKTIAHAISRRAAKLAGIAIAALVDVAVDGSVSENYPGFQGYMREVVRVVEGIGESVEARIRIGGAKDGSSVGVAIATLMFAE